MENETNEVLGLIHTTRNKYFIQEKKKRVHDHLDQQLVVTSQLRVSISVK